MCCHDEFPPPLFVVPPFGKFHMSVVINMTNHFQLNLVPWCMPFEATLQAQLGVAHPADLVHKHRIISPNYPVALIIQQHPTPPTPSSSVCDSCRSLQDWPILHFVGETVGFSSAGQLAIWEIPYCDLMLMTASSPHYDKVTQISTNSLAEGKSHVWIINAAPSDWPQSKFSLKLSISSLLHILYLQSWGQLAATHTEWYFWEVKL